MGCRFLVVRLQGRYSFYRGLPSTLMWGWRSEATLDLGDGYGYGAEGGLKKLVWS